MVVYHPFLVKLGIISCFLIGFALVKLVNIGTYTTYSNLLGNITAQSVKNQAESCYGGCMLYPVIARMGENHLGIWLYGFDTTPNLLANQHFSSKVLPIWGVTPCSDTPFEYMIGSVYSHRIPIVCQVTYLFHTHWPIILPFAQCQSIIDQ